MKKKSGNAIYTNVPLGNTLRKQILSSALDSINTLKRYDKIKEIKERKIEMLKELATQLNTTHNIMGSFNHLMPKIKKEAPIKPEKIKKKTIKKKTVVKKEEKEVQQKLSGLDAEIVDIRMKLREI
jgi:hypothetical protein